MKGPGYTPRIGERVRVVERLFSDDPPFVDSVIEWPFGARHWTDENGDVWWSVDFVVDNRTTRRCLRVAADVPLRAEEFGSAPGAASVRERDDVYAMPGGVIERASETSYRVVPIFMSTDSATRKRMPVATGFLAYFADAAKCVSFVSTVGAVKHCGGVLGWDKSKSADEPDAEVRHMLDVLQGLPPDPGLEELGELGHYASKAWRAMADLQRACDRVRAAYEASQKPGPYSGDSK